MKSSTFYGKVILGSILATIILFGVMPDLLIGVVAGSWHLLLEALHLLFEFTEEGLDIVIEHVLGTGIHNTQIIVFYILFSIIAFFGYRMVLKIPNQYRNIKHNLTTAYTECKSETISYWQNLAPMTKLKWLTIGLFSFIFLFMFGF